MQEKLLRILIGSDPTMPVNLRIFSSFSLMMAVFAAAQFAINLMGGHMASATVLGVGFVTALTNLYFIRVKKQYFYLPIILVVCLIIGVDWFHRGGMNGVILIAMLIVPSGVLLFLPKRYHFTFVLPYLAYVAVLFYFQYNSPELIPPFYPDQKSRVLDLMLSLIPLIFLIALGFRAFVASYEEGNQLIQEQKASIDIAFSRLQSTEEELRQNNEEMLALNEQLYKEKQKAEKALQSLEETQEQLLQAEKMASLGQLTAGVAHEINNPVNFISGGMQTLKDQVMGMVELNRYYQKLAELPEGEEKEKLREKAVQFQEWMGDLEEVSQDIYELFGDVDLGVRRVVEIVNGLQNFSREDENERQAENIAAMIESMLPLLQSECSDQISFDFENKMDNPLVKCAAASIREVFSIVFDNAIDAIQGKGSIRVSITERPDQLQVSIEDSGIGMDEEVQKQLFDPFYTTKEVGKGTGLGLYIAFGIIKQHHGSIEVESELGKGSIFHILLPKHVTDS